MKSNKLLPLAAVVPLGCLANPASAQNKAQRPNVVVIYADDLGYGDVSCNGSTTISTPAIDRVAAEGVRFTAMHSTASVSTPSRYSLLTGEYAWRRKGTGIAPGDANAIITPDRYTLPLMFQQAGYQTAVVGKWHLGLGSGGYIAWNGRIAPGPNEVGFSYSYIIPATGDRVPCVYVENGRVVNLDANDPIEVSYRRNFDGEPTGKDNPELVRLHPSPGQGHDGSIVNGIPRIGFMKGGQSARWKDEDMADVLTERAVAFIRENRERPFFLYLATHDIHAPRVPHPRFVGKSGMGARGDAILQLDWCVGRISETLRELGIDGSTILIVSSDNGPALNDGYSDRDVELLGSHKPAGPLRGGKYSAFEGGTRVPGILRWPGSVKPGVSSALISHVDLLASFAALLRQQLPPGAGPDSQNLLSALLNKSSKGRRYLVTQSVSNVLAIESSRWKYIAPKGGSPNSQPGSSASAQLYHLASDPSEKENVASTNPRTVSRLKRKLAEIVGASASQR